MVLFMTSSPTGDLDGKYQSIGYDCRNGFCDDLKSYWKNNSRVLMITATPLDYSGNEEMVHFFYQATIYSGLSVECFNLLDDRNYDISKEELLGYDVIILGGGHVPTQNAFFHKIGLREKIEGFDGIILAISAGSMNCANIVYAQPELPGEAIDSEYVRYLEGLNLTSINVLPHYQIVKDHYLDDMHLFEEITCKDSDNKMFIALVDGSYIKKTEKGTIVKGEAYKLYPDFIERI